MKSIAQEPDVVTIGGRFGWSLTKALANKYPDWEFFFIMRDEAKVKEARKSRLVDIFFGEKVRQSSKSVTDEQIKLPENVSFYSLSEFNNHFRGIIKKLFIPAISSNATRPVLEKIIAKGVPLSAFKACEILAVSKGMENASLKMVHEVIDEILGSNAVVALGGNLAFDLALGDPMLMEFAGYKQNTSRITQFFMGSNLIIFETKNRRKLSLAGPMKNIHSLATGMTNEIYGNSSVSTMATLGLLEYEHAAFIIQFKENLRSLARIIQKTPFNFRSVPLAGGAMSDYHLFRFTRNFDAGQSFAKLVSQGKSPDEAISIISQGNTIESFVSAVPTRDYLRQLGADSPVIEMMASILSGEISPENGIEELIQQKNVISS